MTRIAPSRVIGGALRTERLSNGKRRLLRAIVVCVERHVQRCDDGGKGETVVVPAGFHTDYSSIPPFGRWLVRWSKVDIAGVVHDYLYSRDSAEPYPMSRRRADEIWYRIARSGRSHANWLQARICWLALRVVSWCFWRATPEVRRRPIRKCIAIALTLLLLFAYLVLRGINLGDLLAMDVWVEMCRCVLSTLRIVALLLIALLLLKLLAGVIRRAKSRNRDH